MSPACVVTLPIQFPKVQMQHPEHPRGEMIKEVQRRLKERLSWGEKEGLLEPDGALNGTQNLVFWVFLDNRKSNSERVKKIDNLSKMYFTFCVQKYIYIYMTGEEFAD